MIYSRGAAWGQAIRLIFVFCTVLQDRIAPPVDKVTLRCAARGVSDVHSVQAKESMAYRGRWRSVLSVWPRSRRPPPLRPESVDVADARRAEIAARQQQR